ncbi:protein-glutamate O-methyltransferase CheR [Ketobacter sp. MCCC 1A13808]|uniref:CheR family methyltransferase n=1 Tax=Ketobacter sp. MCCC 1A13808 TaxID=2602738 RepID=UPI000F12E63A|nr:protein-glutamate O-methyltransferase CheR [Ketobacter sp. MCCC 1A13808]MVF13642.1 protein-glutamate O-methyltransferase CheR [Ketobacter sp. MCCC 1A13808]RLP53141.1 MAG: protein-glutamate O-methyltransferase CheR [Ketobacter sp.]
MSVPAEQWSFYGKSELNDEQFNRWRALLEDRTGMQLSFERKSFLETSLNIRMREIGCADYDIYYDKLMSGLSGEVEWATLVDRLTVQETSFFRHPGSYELVVDYCRKLYEDEGRKDIELWSVGCATGEEAYSLAMVLDELVSEQSRKCYYGITATDISLPALAKARDGVYAARRLERLDKHYVDQYFETAEPGRSRVIKRLKERVCFARINVLDLRAAPMQNVDVVFCQNLLIYFQSWRKKDIVTQLADRLVPGGIMVLGVGEVIDWKRPDLERIQFKDTLAYRKRNQL